MTMNEMCVLFILLTSPIWCNGENAEGTDKTELSKPTTTPIAPVKLADSHVQLTDNKRTKKNDKHLKNRLSSPATKKINVTEGRSLMNKSNTRFRTGNQKINQKWPKVRRLQRQQQTRITKMNMKQMDDEEATTATVPTYKLSVQSDDNTTNEVLSSYNLKRQMERIATKFVNANITIDVIGRTLEYNEIVLLKITAIHEERKHFRADDRKYVEDATEKKVIFIVHGLSIMGMFAIDCLAEEKSFVRLVSYYLEHLDKFDIFLVPMANPDGYGLKEQMWNKNLSPQSACPGVSLDRNFDIAWNGTRAVSSCSQQFPGVAPFTESETRAIRDVLHHYSHKIIAYIHVHAGTYNAKIYKGDAVLYPKGYTDVQTDDDKYIDMKGEIDESMRNASFQVYSVTVDTLYNWYGKVSGTSVDYASTVYGIPYAMEFVMQVYEDDEFYKAPLSKDTGYYVVIEVWKRVIDVVFKNIWNSLNSNEV